jgi:hypothetical protein
MWHFRLDGYMDYFIRAMEKYGYHYTYLDFYPDGRIPPPIYVPEPGAVSALTLATIATLTSCRRNRVRKRSARRT